MRWIVGFFVFIFLLIAGGWAGLNYYIHHKGPLPENTIILIEPGNGFDDITNTLADANAISSSLLFKIWVVLHGQHHDFKAGEFALDKEVAPVDVIAMLVGGKSIQHSITIPEGLISSEILKIISDTKLLSGAAPASLPEASLLPETYYFLRNTARSEIIRRMQDALQTALDAAWQKRQDNLPFHSKEEALILASIVEKETGIADERPKVAAVFINRLRINMKLQSDPTTLYGIYAANGVLKQSLTSKDLATQTAYNTYVIDGLPPGPICHPGRSSIEAVLNPAHTKDLYFVANGSGGHAFAETLEEHNNNVLRYRSFLSEERRKMEK